jgi:Concanavalin A-like lectin/glucanases superfamily
MHTGATDQYNPAGTLAAGSWYYLVVVYDGTTLHLYLNGVELGAGLASSKLLETSAFTFTIGQHSSTGGNVLDGNIAFPAVYPGVALTAAQIANHYAVGMGAPTLPPVVPIMIWP